MQGFTLSTAMNHPAGQLSYLNDPDPFRRSIATFLGEIKSNEGRIPHLNRFHKIMMTNDITMTRMAQTFRNCVTRVNPLFLPTLGNPNSRLNDFLRVLRATDGTDKDCGIYMAIMEDFKKGTSRFGFPPQAYIGQSVGIGVRITSHLHHMKYDPEQEFHWALRDARKIRWFKLAAQTDREEGGSGAHSRAMRDLMETTFMMIFSTMSESVMAPTLQPSTNVATDIAKDYDRFELPRLFVDLATTAFGRNGVTLPRTPAFGLHRYGCNKTIPLGGEVGVVYERTTWCRQDWPDCWTFHRSPLKLKADLTLIHMEYDDHRPDGTTSLIVTLTKAQVEEMEIAKDCEYYVIWEVQKPNKGQHPVPFFRLSEIGPWSNWRAANKVAFKIVWQSTSKIWRTRYLQREARLRLVRECTAQGALLDYSLGIGVYSYFVRTRYPQAQAWTADFGLARVVTARVDNLTQRIIVSHLSTAAVVLHGPSFSIRACAGEMIALGLHNVGGTWRGFDRLWMTDPANWAGGIVPHVSKINPFKQREKCDFCYMANKVC